MIYKMFQLGEEESLSLAFEAKVLVTQASMCLARCLETLTLAPGIMSKNPVWVSRAEALSALDHMMDDSTHPIQTLAYDIAPTDDPTTASLWQSYRLQLLKTTVPSMSVPWPIPAISGWGLIARGSGVVVLSGSVFLTNNLMLSESAEIENLVAVEEPLRVFAWISPPEGMKDGIEPTYLNYDQDSVEVPAHEGSTLHVQIQTVTPPTFTLNGAVLTATDVLNGQDDTIAYSFNTLAFEPGIHNVLINDKAAWQIRVEDDLPPTVHVTNAKRGFEGTLTINCYADDDHGIASGVISLYPITTNPEAQPPAQALLPTLQFSGKDFCGREEQIATSESMPWVLREPR